MNYDGLRNLHPELFRNDDALLKVVTDEKVIREWQIVRSRTLSEKKLPPEWAEIGMVLNDPYFMVVRDLVQFPDGHMNGYCRVLGQADLKGGRGVVVLPEYQGRILLLHQYRHPTRKWHYEVPRGYGEPNTPAEMQARTEIEEETGGKIAELVDLGEFYNNTGFEGGAVSLFYGKLASIGVPNENEGIESFVWLEIAEFEKWIADGKITDGFTIAAYTKAKLRKLI